jgi:hypothetical protein
MTSVKELLELFVLTPGNVDSCFKAAKEGDRRAQLCMHAFAGLVERLKTEAAICLCDDCSCEFDRSSMPAVFVILLPVFLEADATDETAVVTGMCMACVRKGEVRETAVEHLGRLLGKDCVVKVSVH